MKKRLLICFLLIYLCIPIAARAIATNSSDDINYVKIYYFTSDNCVECDKGKEWLENYQKEDNRISIEYINDNDLNNQVKNVFNIKEDNMPLITIGSNYFIGFNDKVEKDLKEAIKSYEEKEEYCDVVSKVRNGEDTKDCIKQNKDIYKQENTSNSSNTIKFVIIGVIIVLIIGAVFILKKKKTK